MMRTRVIVPSIFFCVALSLCVVFRPPPQPVYNGKPLSEWINGLSPMPERGKYRPTKSQAEKAIKQMGPVALPLLVKWVANDRALNWRRWFKMVIALPRPLQTSRLILWLGRKVEGEDRRAETRAWAAQQALIFLGPDAVPAIPDLVRIFQKRGGPNSAYLAGNVLSTLGKDALPTLLQCCADPTCNNQEALVDLIGHMRDLGEAAAPAVPIICNLLEQADPDLRNTCAAALGNLGAVPELSVPALAAALTNALQNQLSLLSRKCAEALGKFGVSSSNAVPVLCAALKSPDGITTEEAARALGKIGAHGELAVPTLIRYLRDGATRHWKYAIEGLIPYGDAAQEAIPLLQQALEDPDHDTRALAQEALQELRSDVN
jgi:HEAT repeat protein